jgi:hypothetical protein
MAARLRNNFNNEHVMLVFKVKDPGGCSGDLVTTDDGKVSTGGNVPHKLPHQLLREAGHVWPWHH